MGKRRSYDAEFREGAVRIVLETGKPAAEVARDLGVHEGTLQTWVSRARGAAEAGTGPLNESEREELLRLRADNQRLRKETVELGMERDVLKRCMVLWVK
ncbi:transposase [Streptomyces sp. MUSC 125]|uniref:transposase n=1 Tax=unclassified Streptomyces TaxID=2593676 RepID=UPI00057CF557|nr:MULTISPECIES: transposase [unclassified Streptomyces]KIE27958.1 transposase [Streptomyces sp. MUSC 125]